ncbi:MAG: UDP-N-acetylmuramate dehydrogenase [Proteobacteria bacterium]|nr:UDP-N-acetylmuramate dehydrogenase [Pseudomonadota bacterium]MBU1708375.1 UDP-N-acetylmuramate dehydrogenase [Pseudomonadota bacterium]
MIALKKADSGMNVQGFNKQFFCEIWKGRVEWDHPLASYATLNVGGPAKAVVFPEDIEALAGLIRALGENGINWRVIGRGSNILVPDRGYDGVVIILGQELSAITMLADNDRRLVRAEAGASLAKLLTWTSEKELSGLEFVAGIPGTVGGAIVMNAGAHGKEVSDVLATVTIIEASGAVKELRRKDVVFQYRGWGRKDEIVVAGTFALVKGQRRHIDEECRRFQRQRRESQPQGVASAGSFFKNPPTQAAGYLIEKAGLKGVSFGGAQVSEKHANFIINSGKATTRDIIKLMRHVQEKVLAMSGVRLEPEVDIWDDQ